MCWSKVLAEPAGSNRVDINKAWRKREFAAEETDPELEAASASEPEWRSSCCEIVLELRQFPRSPSLSCDSFSSLAKRAAGLEGGPAEVPSSELALPGREWARGAVASSSSMCTGIRHLYCNHISRAACHIARILTVVYQEYVSLPGVLKLHPCRSEIQLSWAHQLRRAGCSPIHFS